MREFEGQAVVADPVLEEVAEDVERLGAGNDLGKELLETRRGLGPRRIQVQVRDEEGAPQTSSAFSITTATVGTFWCMPASAVATLRILSTTSWPSVTLPKTA